MLADQMSTKPGAVSGRLLRNGRTRYARSNAVLAAPPPNDSQLRSVVTARAGKGRMVAGGIPAVLRSTTIDDTATSAVIRRQHVRQQLAERVGCQCHGTLRPSLREKGLHVAHRVGREHVRHDRDLESAPHNRLGLLGHRRAVGGPHRTQRRVQPSRGRFADPREFHAIPLPAQNLRIFGALGRTIERRRPSRERRPNPLA